MLRRIERAKKLRQKADPIYSGPYAYPSCSCVFQSVPCSPERSGFGAGSVADNAEVT